MPTLRCILPLLCLVSLRAWSAAYYVDSVAGNDNNSGASTAAPWKTLAKVNGRSFAAGDVVNLKRASNWAETLRLNSSGTASNRIAVAVYGSGAAPIMRQLEVNGAYTTFSGFTVDQNKAANDAVKVDARNVTLNALTVCNGTKDGIDMNDADGSLIEGCLIYNFLGGSSTTQVDAHGIVCTDTQGLTIRNTEIHHVSGDSFQTDPDRDTDYPNNIVIENCRFWTGPLPASFNSSWPAGASPGENAVDTKVDNTSAYTGAPRMNLTIRNTVAYGWTLGGTINNRAAFNLKEKINAVLDRITVYDCEIAFRIRGSLGNADTALSNVVIYRCDKAIRAENDLSNLVVYHSTFGGNLAEQLQFAGGSGGTGSWTWRNNAFLGSKPSVASHSSNKIASNSAFVNGNAHDYRLPAGSPLIDAGVALAAVSLDRDAVARPQGTQWDVGAYERIANVNLAPDILSFPSSNPNPVRLADNSP